MIFDGIMHPCTALVPVETPTNVHHKRPRACVYVRYFSERERQRINPVDDITAYCNTYGITVGECYQEIAKPYKIIRPALWQLLKAACQGRVDVLVITELKQLSAQKWKLKLILQYLHRKNVRLITTKRALPEELFWAGLDGKTKIGGWAGC